MLPVCRFFTLCAVLLFAGISSATAAPASNYTASDRAEIEACIDRAQRNSQHARACIGSATRACEREPDMASNAGLKGCMMRENAYWDEILNDRYQKLLAIFSDKNVKKLRAMQRSWIAWRKEKCELPYMLYEGGTMAGVMALNCFMETTGIRALELDEAIIAP